MVDQTDLDLRYRAHTERIERVNGAPVHRLLEPVTQRGPRVFVADVLLRLSYWLAPEAIQQVTMGNSATAPS